MTSTLDQTDTRRVQLSLLDRVSSVPWPLLILVIILSSIGVAMQYSAGGLKKAVNENFPKTHPAAAAMYKKLSFNTSQIGAMAALVDEDKMSHEDAAKKWLANNEKVWKKWAK